jgi:phosphoribosylamine-glycine ligase
VKTAGSIITIVLILSLFINDIQAQTDPQAEKLMTALIEKDFENALALVSAFDSVNYREEEGQYSLLMYAAEDGYTEDPDILTLINNYKKKIRNSLILLRPVLSQEEL